ncbi:Hypothetical predicted protein [Paramuricea clavata]|uniref:Uncharacterized protein n=1 Tax=Paramuricea clavata TaxID=317549 RepID=A0A7D9E977_PARCT|nr:Hypothetical predicted protein [Paramuricea clavata]
MKKSENCGTSAHFFLLQTSKDKHITKRCRAFLSCHSLSKSGQTIGTMLEGNRYPQKKVEKKHDTVLQTKVQEALQTSKIYLQFHFQKVKTTGIAYSAGS